MALSERLRARLPPVEMLYRGSTVSRLDTFLGPEAVAMRYTSSRIYAQTWARSHAADSHELLLESYRVDEKCLRLVRQIAELHGLPLDPQTAILVTIAPAAKYVDADEVFRAARDHLACLRNVDVCSVSPAQVGRQTLAQVIDAGICLDLRTVDPADYRISVL